MPNRIPARFYGLGKPGDTVAHPSGLFWFHAHLHTVARPQVTSGMSGLISIGDPYTHLRVDREDEHGASQMDEAATRALRAATDVRYLALRDIQVEVPSCPDGAPGCDRAATLPDHIGAGAPPVQGTEVVDEYSPGLCGSPPAGKDGPFPGLPADATAYAKPDTGFCAAMLVQPEPVNRV